MKLIAEEKGKHLANLSSKSGNPDTAPKAYWSVINKFLNNIKMPIIPPAFSEGKIISDFQKKLNFLIITLPHNVLWSKMQVPYQLLNIKPLSD